MDVLDKISSILDDKQLTQKDLTDYLGLQSAVYTKWNLGKTPHKRKEVYYE